MSRLWAGQLRNLLSNAGRSNRFLSLKSRSVSGTHPTSGLLGVGQKAARKWSWPLSSIKINKAWSCISILPYAFIVCRGKFYIFLTYRTVTSDRGDNTATKSSSAKYVVVLFVYYCFISTYWIWVIFVNFCCLWWRVIIFYPLLYQGTWSCVFF